MSPPHWHARNPWADSAVYVPVAELARCLDGLGERVDMSDGTTRVMTVAYELKRWSHFGDKLDAYILPQPSGHHSAGVRYGPAPDQYLSPHCNPKSLQHLLERYLVKKPSLTPRLTSA